MDLSILSKCRRKKNDKLSTLCEDGRKQSFLESRDSRDVENAFQVPHQSQNLNCRISAPKLVLIVTALGAVVTFFYSPAIHVADRPKFAYQWEKHDIASDARYISTLDIDFDHISRIARKLNGTSSYQGIGLLNFNSSEIDDWGQLFPDVEHVVLQLQPAMESLNWESLYPEWIDEEEEFEIPVCPTLPKLKIPGKPRLDFIAVKLPCNKSGSWSRDVARLHLQLAAASIGASPKSYHVMHVLLVTESECFPSPNLFTCRELVYHGENLWIYKLNPNTLRDKLRLPVGSCELAVPLQAKENFYSEREKREAYATILHTANMYVCGAIAAAQSIRMTGSTRDLVILVDETVSAYHREGLEAAGWRVRTIERIRNPKAEKDAYNEWNYSKFRLWQLTEYSKIIFLDADLLVMRNIDFLFEMPEISATGNNATLFNSGLMVVEPSSCTFDLLMGHIGDIESYNGGDQGYLNEVFTWWHRIPKHMNFLKHFWEGDGEEKKTIKTHLFGADPPVLYVLHYLGYKPWLCFRDYDCNWNVGALREFASDVAHKTWWRVHDAMPENLHKYCLLRSKQKAALEWDRRQAEKASYRDGHWKIKIQDKRLETCFEDFCFWESMLWHWNETVKIS